MDDRETTKAQLLDELIALRQRVAFQAEVLQRTPSEGTLVTRVQQMEAVRAVTIELTRELHLCS